MQYSLIIPCFNEGKNLPLLVERAHEISKTDDFELIFVNNGSKDNSRDVFNEILEPYLNFKVVNLEKNLGYGGGIIAGLKEAKGEILGWTHADMQTDLRDFIKGVKIVKKYGSNIFLKGKRYGRPVSDVFFTVGMSLFESVLLRCRLWDINAQPTIFSREFFHKWVDEAPNDFSLDLFVYYYARKMKLNIHRFPVAFTDRAFGSSNWNVSPIAKWKHILKTMSYSLHMKTSLKNVIGPQN